MNPSLLYHKLLSHPDLMEYYLAVAGDGPKLFTWKDKPHRRE